MLKYREIAKQLYQVEVKNGMSTSFWYDPWSSLGCLYEKLGERGCMDLGIPLTKTVGEVMNMSRRRRHRQGILNQIEVEVQMLIQNRVDQHDIALWKGKSGQFRNRFISSETWSLTRTERPTMAEHKEIWFSFSTPKYAFLTWLVVKNRISTADRMINWNCNANVSCVFCKNPMETREHLFFSCPFTRSVWEKLAGGLLLQKFTVSWRETLRILNKKELDRTQTFILNYVFQNTIHSVWKERNDRRHGEQPLSVDKLVTWIDKNVRNRLSTVRELGARNLADGLQVWLTARTQHNNG